MNDYLQFYDLEKYLFGEVGFTFRNTGNIEPVDFFMIFIWKANRAKTRVRDRLKNNRKAGSFEKAVKQIAQTLWTQQDRKERLRILMEEWELRLPMASAILTVLYPDEFTVYDRRVCEQLHIKGKDWTFSDACWIEYERFQKAVVDNTPANLNLRDKDRFLWGKSQREDAEQDCKS